MYGDQPDASESAASSLGEPASADSGSTPLDHDADTDAGYRLCINVVKGPPETFSVIREPLDAAPADESTPAYSDADAKSVPSFRDALLWQVEEYRSNLDGGSEDAAMEAGFSAQVPS
jgi:hypothetical protein